LHTNYKVDAVAAATRPLQEHEHEHQGSGIRVRVRVFLSLGTVNSQTNERKNASVDETSDCG
jgi:hypothetical protein